MARGFGTEDNRVSEAGGYSRVKASLAKTKLWLSPSIRVRSASRDEESSWLWNKAVSGDRFSALEPRSNTV